MKKIRFIIVGSGWRSLYYVRIAKALPNVFELCAMLCRTTEKAEKMAMEHHIYTTTSIEECRNMKPDFAVVVVNKASIAQVSIEWMNYGFTVLCETPASLELPVLNQLWHLHQSGKRLVVAEQYTSYPTYKAMLDILNKGFIGEPDCMNISLAHEYHGASLMRAFLKESVSTSFTINAKCYEFNTAETLSRYECFKDGRCSLKKRVVATFEFADGKVAWYDFDSEQYRSTIRKNYVKVQGYKGILKDNCLYFLDDHSEPQKGELIISEQITTTDSENPNLKYVHEISEIYLENSHTGTELIYKAPYGICGLNEDETAIAQLMKEAAEYTWACESSSASCENPHHVREMMRLKLQNALQDSYMAILLQQAVESGKTVISEPQIWH